MGNVAPPFIVPVIGLREEKTSTGVNDGVPSEPLPSRRQKPQEAAPAGLYVEGEKALSEESLDNFERGRRAGVDLHGQRQKASPTRGEDEVDAVETAEAETGRQLPAEMSKERLGRRSFS